MSACAVTGQKMSRGYAFGTHVRRQVEHTVGVEVQSQVHDWPIGGAYLLGEGLRQALGLEAGTVAGAERDSPRGAFMAVST